MKPTEYTKFESAKKRVTAIQKFYNHVLIYVLVNCAVVVGWYLSMPDIGVLDYETAHFQRWVFWNIILFPTIWAVVLIVHGMSAYGKFSFVKKWEARKMKEFIENDEQETNRWS